MTTKIYAMTDLDGCIRYIGKTAHSLQGRRSEHLLDARKGKSGHRCNWIRSLVKTGKLPNIQLLGEVSGSGSVEEIAWIKYFRDEGVNLVNDTDGGEGMSGYKASDETKKKLSLCRIGHKTSEETKTKISISEKGRVRLDLRGVSRTLEVREKIRQAKLGKELSDKHIKALTGVRHKVSSATRKMWAERNKKRYSNSEEREKSRTRMLQYWRTHERPEISEETRKKLSLSHMEHKKPKEECEAHRRFMLKYWQEKRKVA